MRGSILLRMLIMLGLYGGLSFYGGELGWKILYPVRLFVTFLHEFGHAIGAVITGGSVLDVQINADGSGFTKSMGGNRAVTIMGGYLGSALFGNILFYIGARGQKMVKPMLGLVILSMIVTGFVWFNSVYTTCVLIGFSLVFAFIMMKTNFGAELLMFIGLASVLYIIQDFNVGPTSDLKAYEEVMVVLPAQVWMYIWLGIAILLLLFNLKMLFKSGPVSTEYSDY